ncbi:MAG: RNA polymerase sigma factor [Sporocytophaga sp.]|nr:RNA polymerase sigma factor [Sporocytophaga sp.]
MEEEEIIDQIKNGNKSLYGLLIQKYNQRLYRIARAIVGKDADLEDIMQETYIKAYQNLAQFRKESQFSTWLIRILINNANATLSMKRQDLSSIPLDTEDIIDHHKSPDLSLTNEELKIILEKAIDHLPENLRSVFVMREIEQLSVHETALNLGISEENVKTRLHRAKSSLKEELYSKFKMDVDLFRFAGSRCEGVFMAVMSQINQL